MPGIAGIISRSSPEKNKLDLNLMTEAMVHHPASSTGTYAEARLGLFVGWVSHEGSFSDCMPVMNGKKDLVLFFAGENFAGRDVEDLLKARGHHPDLTRAQYLMHLYEEEPAEFFTLLNGWFSGVLVDLNNKRIILFNDRYGMGRLYFHEDDGEFIFATEAKALLKVRRELRGIDHQGLAQFLMWDCVLGNRSLFPGIDLVPGGALWTFNNGPRPRKQSYFTPGEWENRTILSSETFHDRLGETFAEVLPRYFRANGPIAMSVSSGLDTRAIMACMDVKPGELPCHTFSGIHRETLDAVIARRIARACHQPHEVLRLDRGFLSDFADHARQTVYVSDGCLNVNGSYDGHFNERVREIAPIRMTGKFGSEVVRNHSMLRKAFSFPDGMFHPDFRMLLDGAVETLEEYRSGHDLTFALFKEIPWNEHGRLAMEMAKLTLRTPYMDNDLVDLLYQAPDDARESIRIILGIIEHGNPALLEIMTDRGTAGKLKFPLSRLARLYYYFFEKSEYVYLVQLPHRAARLEKYASFLHPEKLLAGRHQLGYYRLWYRDALSDYIKEILLDDRTLERPFLDRKFLLGMVTDHTSGRANYTGEINKALTVELIYRHLVEDI